ncbi:MAG TPA: FtsX-like permease family protein, partial [candidate division Zixibacteria bacterium]|nr:FtsX-like permease family protein [candidate division Zixibacteria bacterium]
IKAQNGVEGVEYGEAWVERLDKLSSVFLKVALIFGIFLTLAILMMVTTTVRLIIITKSETLKLLKVLGAKTSFILKPYFLGGMLLGFSATGLSVLGLNIVHQFFKSKFWTVSFLPLEILGGVILGVLFLSAVGSLFSMTRVLKV